MASSVNLKATGLNISTNALELQNGELLEASNVIIKRNDIIESRRGYKLWGDSMGSSTDRAKQLINYKQRIIRHYGTTLEFQDGLNNDGSVNFTAFNGSYTEPVSNVRMRSIESNGNLYFTTSDGIKKISAKSTSDLTASSGYITNAGGIKALDVQGSLDVTLGQQSGFLTEDGAVAYRIVWGTNDLNNNLILGTPSETTEVYNPLQSLLIRDLNNVLTQLDNVSYAGGSLISDGDYFSSLGLELSDTALQVRLNLIALAAKLDVDIKLADNIAVAPLQIDTTTTASGISGTNFTITFSSGDPTTYITAGDFVILGGFTPTTGTLSDNYVVSTVTSTTIILQLPTVGTPTGPVSFTAPTIYSYNYEAITQPGIPSTPPTNSELLNIQTYYLEIISRLQSELIGVISSSSQTTYIAPLDATTSADVRLEITIPEDVTANYFFQVYRSSIALADGAIDINRISPNDELGLVYEAYPTTAELAAKSVTVIDITPDAFKGANLYTNAATGEGILQANDIPPWAKDINRFKNAIFYANTKTRYRKQVNILGVIDLLDEYGGGTTPQMTITDGDTTNTYSFVTGIKEVTPITIGAAECSANTLASSGTADWFTLNSANDNFLYYFWYKKGTTVAPTVTDIPDIADRTSIEIDISASVSKTITTISTGSTPQITTSTAHGFVTGDIIGINGSDSTPPIDGVYSISYVDATNFTISVSSPVTVVGTTGTANSNPNGLIASRTRDKINTLLDYFSSSTGTTPNTHVITVTNIDYGLTTNAEVSSNLTLGSITQGRGEDVSLRQVLLSDDMSPSIAADQTARSLVRVINKDTNSSIYAYYLSGSTDVPGKMLFEARSLGTPQFFITSNNSTTGTSFNPDISPEVEISSITTGPIPVITTTTAHGLVNQDQIIIGSSDSTPSIDGIWTISYIDSTSFSIIPSANITIAGTYGSVIKKSDAIYSDNDAQKHRIYYSKTSQPEAVPILNYFDVGAQDKEILRIFPLRDSLFVFKEDGLYRVSGEVAPYTLALFDSSTNLVAADTLDVNNNLIYGLTTQGVVSVSESGASIISRNIDVEILKVPTYDNYKTISWGVGYESDNSYTLYTLKKSGSSYADIAYRYSNLTGSWTTFDKTATCGIINSIDDRQYLGAGDVNSLEQERKSFTRYDYSDREYTKTLPNGGWNFEKLTLPNIDNIELGDVITQEQTLSVYQYNGVLLKLVLDSGTALKDYTDLTLIGGSNIRDAIVALAAKLDVDTGVAQSDFSAAIGTITGTITAITDTDPAVITCASHGLANDRIINISGSDSTPSIDGNYQVTVIDANTFSIDFSVTDPGTTGSFVTQDSDFRDIEACYNKIIQKLNADTGISFSNYAEITTSTIQEAVVIAINKQRKQITLNLDLPFVVGPLTVYKAIDTNIVWAPVTFEDPLSYKHLREATIMFANKAFTNAELAFASDLLPMYNSISFNGDGSGIFGHQDFGSGFFGGGSNGAPFRTLIPRDNQRCRYLLVKFRHDVAREQFAIYGITITGESGVSTRAYR